MQIHVHKQTLKFLITGRQFYIASLIVECLLFPQPKEVKFDLSVVMLNLI